MLFSIIAVPVYIPINTAQGFPFFQTFAYKLLSHMFDSSDSNICKVIFYCGFDLHFLDV